MTDATLGELTEAIATLARMKEKPIGEVFKAVNRTRAMQEAGASEDTENYTEQQARIATTVVNGWIERSNAQ